MPKKNPTPEEQAAQLRAFQEARASWSATTIRSGLTNG
jgi:hypothetical protein